jgi:TP901 family phage tail tape measure protein
MGSGVLRNLAGDFNNLNGAAKKAAQQQMQTGSSLMAVGVAIGAVGAAGLVFLGKATSSAIEYNKQVALTKTQMYGVKASFDQVSEAGLATARSIAVPLDQIQGGLYDIFSSMDVNLTQAKFLLNNFSKEAVAGQVDLSTAERATIGILNAYGLKVQDVTKVQDIMFNLVKYGVGTYGDFANSIGRVTGPAVRQNQTFEQTAALMAFVTRNGLSASQAASTVGRALDALGKSRDKVQSLGATVEDALGVQTAHKLGFTHDQMIKVTDAAGKMLPINQIMTNLGMALKGLNPTQLNDVLTTMFKGTGGTIQAMRFFDIAIHNFGQLNTMVGNMAKSKGALKAAYDIMSNTPAAKIQLLKNNFQAFMIVLGQQFLPIVKVVASVLANFFKFLGTIPKPFIAIIAIVIAVVSVMLVLTGVVMVAIGAWMVFSAILAATDIALAPIALTIGLIIAAVAALAVAAYLIYKYWDPISKWFHDMWFDMWHWIDHIWSAIANSISDAWNNIMGVFNRIMHFISGSFDQWWKTHGESVKEVWHAVWDNVTSVISVAWQIIGGIIKVGMAELKFAWDTGLATIELISKTAWAIIEGIFRIAWTILSNVFKIGWAELIAVAKIGWAGITSVVKIAWDVIVAIFSVFLDILTGHWHTALVDIQNLGKQIWNNIKGFLIASWNAIKGAAGPIFNALKAIVVNVWHSVYDTTQSVWHNILSFLNRVWGDMKSGARSTVNGLSSIWHGIENIFRVPVNFVIGTVYDNGIKRLWNDVMGAIGLKRFNLPNIPMMAAGGKLPGFGGGDVIPALLEGGETVIDKHRSRQFGWLFRMMGVKGYQSGGQIPPAVARFGTSVNPTGPALGPLQGILHLAGAAGKMLMAAATGNETAFSNALISALGIKSGAGSQLASMAATLPVALAKKAIGGLWHSITGSAGGAGINYKAGAGVAQWRGLVLRALGMEGLSPSLVGAVLYQMQTESGGNPRAINLSDINAQHGDPSRGLMQTIMSTFLAYHWPGTSTNIYDPLANIAAALNYARHVYGPTLMSGGLGIGSGHGYALGTNWAAPGHHVVGEHGPEVVSMRGGERVTPGGQTIIIYTNEINPRRHAAELGWELARRSA